MKVQALPFSISKVTFVPVYLGEGQDGGRCDAAMVEESSWFP